VLSLYNFWNELIVFLLKTHKTNAILGSYVYFCKSTIGIYGLLIILSKVHFILIFQ
jgi:hypothetical protein